MSNIDLLHQFYGSFSKANAEGMNACYHENIIFKDPANGELHGERAKAMWSMLLSRNKNIRIDYEILEVAANSACVEWQANYEYGPEKRKIHNNVLAYFKFEDGKIIKHRDRFSLWNWSKQALGITGQILGWTGYLKNKIQNRTNKLLNEYMQKQPIIAEQNSL